MKKQTKPKKTIDSGPKASVTLRSGSNGFSNSCIWVERGNFYGSKQSDEYIIVGFDTEFKTPDEPLPYEAIRAGEGKYKVLSYQVHCSVYDSSQPDAREWSGICYPNDGDQRLGLADILIFAFSEGIKSGAVKKIPSTVYIAGHFTRADFPALADFQNLSELISSVRSTFLSIDGHIPLNIQFSDEETIELKVVLRDTMLLTPATSKSLKALGDLVGLEKVSLDPNSEKALFYKSNMDKLLEDHPERFEKYAINDAIICVRYLEQLIDQCEEILGAKKVPATLTSIGVDLLMQSWKNDLQIDPLELLGQERIQERYFSKKHNHYFKKRKTVNLQEVDWHVALATECYHGGRNEQFWFGPAFEDDWTDYDLAGAYPTAMALIGRPDWRSIRVSLDIADYTASTLGIGRVEFKFPDSVRFPTLPVRTENGLIFPREGVSDCAAPEIALAHALGAELKIKHGVVIPTDNDTLIFGDFISDCIKKRLSYPKGSLKALFWKELSNSSYGKTAQGLRQKRVYDLRDREMKPLPPSKITNPFFAAFITSFVRSNLGEIMNALPDDVCVFSCTTDGFLTNATELQIEAASNGPISDLFRRSRGALTGDPTMLEIKHRVRQPLGWRTRGQATLKEGKTEQGDNVNIVLAKGGIYTASHLDDDRLQNDHIVKLFFNRNPEDQIPLKVKTGVRDIIEFDADLVEKSLSKRLNMEFDWKRRPVSAWVDPEFGHIAFTTEPWDTSDQFAKMREYWESFGIVNPRCIKTEDDYREFAIYVLSQSSLEQNGAKYLRKKDPDITRLRQMLCAAWRQSKAGLIHRVDGKSAQAYADILSAAGIACKRSDVENARKPFIPNMCPSTPAVTVALQELLSIFPNLDSTVLLSSGQGIDLIGTLDTPRSYRAVG
mgnify:CR=1 FL=1